MRTPSRAPHLGQIFFVAAAFAVVAAAIPPFTWAQNTVATLSCVATLFGFWPRCVRSNVAKLAAFFVVGLLFSVLGDYFMNVRGGNERVFIAGIGAFFLAHLAFFLGFLTRTVRRRFFAFAAPTFAAAVIYYAVRLYPAIDGSALKTAVFAYLTISILSLSGAFAVDLRPLARTAAFLGVASIVFSDVLIAESVFCNERKLVFLIIPTYIATHFLLTTHVVFAEKRAEVAASQNDVDDAAV